MYNIYYSKIGNPGSGLTNQLFSLITSIILAYATGKKIVIVDDFYSDYSESNSGVPISKIFDLDQINNYLNKNYDIIILDRHNIDFRINNVLYGYADSVFDITETFKNLFVKESTLFIPKNTKLNSLAGDPCFGTKKTLTLYYSLNGYNFRAIFD